MSKTTKKDNKKRKTRKLDGTQTIMDQEKGAPIKVTLDVMTQICTMIAIGIDWRHACRKLNVDDEYLYQVLKAGALGNDPRRNELYRMFVRAVSTMEVNDLMVIQQATQGRQAKYEKQVTYEDHIDPNTGQVIQLKKEKYVKVQSEMDPDWKAAAWRLSKKFPYRWGDRMQIEVDEVNKLRAKQAESTQTIEDQLLQWAKSIEKNAEFEEKANRFIEIESMKDVKDDSTSE